MKTLTIRHKSIRDFISAHATKLQEVREYRGIPDECIEGVFLQEQIFIDKIKIEGYDKVIFEVAPAFPYKLPTKKKIHHVYTYDVIHYDDLKAELKISDFDIKLLDPTEDK